MHNINCMHAENNIIIKFQFTPSRPLLPLSQTTHIIPYEDKVALEANEALREWRDKLIQYYLVSSNTTNTCIRLMHNDQASLSLSLSPSLSLSLPLSLQLTERGQKSLSKSPFQHGGCVVMATETTAQQCHTCTYKLSLIRAVCPLGLFFTKTSP